MKFANIFQKAVQFAEEIMGPGNGNRKLHIAVEIIKAILSVGVSTGLVGRTLGEADAHDTLSITNELQKTVRSMNESGQLPGHVSPEPIEQAEQASEPIEPPANVGFDLSKALSILK